MHYNTTSRIVIQGRPLLLFNEALVYITELVDLYSVPKLFNDNYKIEIKKDDILIQFESYLPNSCKYFQPKMKKVLLQSIYNLNLSGEMFTYDFLVFPALKALEGHLKMILSEHSINIDQRGFEIFYSTDNGQNYILKDSYVDLITCTKKRKYIEDAYGHYNRQRHTLFHWANPAAPFDQTRILESNGQARGLIMDTLKIIDQYFVL